MSYKNGLAALNLEFTEKIPRTEYSVDSYHWELIQKATGIDTTIEGNREKARKEFIKIWDYAFLWMTPTATGIIHDRGIGTKMGHAEFSQNGSDYSSEMYCPFKTVEEIYEFDPYEEYGEVNQNELAKKLNEQYHRDANYWGGITLTMGGIYPTLFSGLIEIFGWDMLIMAIGYDSEKFDKVIESYFKYVKQYFEAWAKTDAIVFMSHDDICWTSGPVASPDWYRKYIFQRYKELWKPILESGKKLIFTSDGKYDIFFDDIVECGAHMLVMEPGNDMKSFADKYGNTHGFVGNADTRILLYGTKQDIYNEVKQCMDIGKKYPGFIMAVGNHIPANTPVENALYYDEIYNKLGKR